MILLRAVRKIHSFLPIQPLSLRTATLLHLQGASCYPINLTFPILSHPTFTNSATLLCSCPQSIKVLIFHRVIHPKTTFILHKVPSVLFDSFFFLSEGITWCFFPLWGSTRDFLFINEYRSVNLDHMCCSTGWLFHFSVNKAGHLSKQHKNLEGFVISDWFHTPEVLKDLEDSVTQKVKENLWEF